MTSWTGIHAVHWLVYCEYLSAVETRKYHTVNLWTIFYVFYGLPWFSLCNKIQQIKKSEEKNALLQTLNLHVIHSIFLFIKFIHSGTGNIVPVIQFFLCFYLFINLRFHILLFCIFFYNNAYDTCKISWNSASVHWRGSLNSASLINICLGNFSGFRYHIKKWRWNFYLGRLTRVF